MGLLGRIVLVLVGGSLAALIWAAGAGAPAAAPFDADAIASKQRLESWIREQAEALQARGRSLAKSPLLAALALTDAATCEDLTQDELGFTPFANETIELVQLDKDRTARLLRVPARRELPIDWSRRGYAIAVDADTFVITEVLPVGERGAVAVSWRYDPTAMARGTTDLVGGSLVVGTATLPIGTPGDGPRMSPLALDVPDPASYVAVLGAAGKPTRWPLRAGGLALGAVLAVVAACWPRRRRDAGTGTEVTTDSGRFARYEPLALVEANDVSNVYVARLTGERGFERRVTLDVVHAPIASDPELAAALLEDVRVAARVSHPNLVEILDLGYTGQKDCFIASEYVEGGDLGRLLAHARTTRRLVPIGVVIAIARRICDGLEAAHSAVDADGQPLGIVHRDVRASNVYVSRSGTVKLGRFGLASARPSAQDVRRSGLDARTHAERLALDVYGVGAIVYELLTLATFAPEVPASTLRADLPYDLDAIIARATAVDRADRHARCAELEADLARVASALALELGDREITQWLATELLGAGWSPTLRGWPALPAQHAS